MKDSRTGVMVLYEVEGEAWDDHQLGTITGWNAFQLPTPTLEGFYKHFPYLKRHPNMPIQVLFRLPDSSIYTHLDYAKATLPKQVNEIVYAKILPLVEEIDTSSSISCGVNDRVNNSLNDDAATEVCILDAASTDSDEYLSSIRRDQHSMEGENEDVEENGKDKDNDDDDDYDGDRSVSPSSDIKRQSRQGSYRRSFSRATGAATGATAAAAPVKEMLKSQAAEWSEQAGNAWGKAADWSTQAFDRAKKNLTSEDALAKQKALKTAAQKAQKWGGALWSSLGTSISNASTVLLHRTEATVTVGQTTVHILKPLAEGAFSQVFHVKCATTGTSLAMKHIICDASDAVGLQEVDWELHVCRSMQGQPNVIQLVDFGEAALPPSLSKARVGMKESGTLWNRIEKALATPFRGTSDAWPFSEPTCLALFHDIVQGVYSMHQRGFTHRDIKPHNVLLGSEEGDKKDDERGGESRMSDDKRSSNSSSYSSSSLNQDLVVMDLGSAGPLTTSITCRKEAQRVQDEAARKCSLPFRAPELLDPQVPSTIDGQVDVWSLGCLLYAMAFGRSPFESPTEGFLKLACLNGRVVFPNRGRRGLVEFRGHYYSNDFVNFIAYMVKCDPKERATILDVQKITKEMLDKNQNID